RRGASTAGTAVQGLPEQCAGRERSSVANHGSTGDRRRTFQRKRSGPRRPGQNDAWRGRRDRARPYSVPAVLGLGERSGGPAMNGRWRRWLLAGLCVVVVIAAIYFPKLKRRVKTTAHITQPSEEQARRELTPPSPASASDPIVKARMF